jgi:hypothetical protein
VAAPRRRLPLLRLAALPEARAERRAGGGVENGFYVLGLRAEARLVRGRIIEARWRPPRPTKDRVSIFRSLQGLGAQPSPNGGPAFGRKKDRTLGAQLFSSVSPAASSRIRGLSVPDAQNYGPQRIEPKRHNLSEPARLVSPRTSRPSAAKRTGLRAPALPQCRCAALIP